VLNGYQCSSYPLKLGPHDSLLVSVSLEGNSLRGDLTAVFCSRNITFLSADCYRPDIDCFCCTQCCDENGC